MSFFDDEDDAIEEEPRRTPRPSADARPRSASSSPRSGSRSGGPRRPPSHDPAIERRRWVAGGAVVVVVILMIVLISSCQARNTKNSLEDYNNSVSSLISKSDATGATVFGMLGSGKGGSAIAANLVNPLADARSELTSAKDLSVPDQMTAAQSHVLLALQMRADGIQTIANQVQSVGGSSNSETTSAVTDIAGAMARFYASDVVYKDYGTTAIASALNGDKITGYQINGGQFLSDLGWLSESFIATKLGVTLSGGSGGSGSTSSSQCPTGDTCGDAIDAVSVGSNTLTTAATNSVAGSPAPTFSISVTNGGDIAETGVKCTVSVSGGPSGSATIASIASKATGTCNVTLSRTVTAGAYSVTVNVAKVPGEANLTNNTAKYTIQFS